MNRAYVMEREEKRIFHFFKSLPLPLKVFMIVADVAILIGLLYYFS